MPRCFYEVLGVSQEASTEELKSAYRKLALTWHPDKNQARVEEATVRFKEIQNAYEVLGDKHERAWYDSHRESIIRGSDNYYGAESGAGGGGKASRPEDDVDLWGFFSSSVFSGFSDTGRGFYAVYSGVFAQIFKQEMGAAKREGKEKEIGEPPPLGGPTTPYSEVAVFYNYWLSFSTLKDFAWCDEYNLAAAPNRRTRRLMEEENKKLRKKARREFNDTVRQMAAFVRKRDKRVLEHQREVQRLAKQREEELKARRLADQKERAARAQRYVDQDWARGEEEVGEGEDEETEEDEAKGSYDWTAGKARGSGNSAGGEDERPSEGGRDEEGRKELFCIVCGKKFRSQKQWENHEKSRKHLDRVAQLKQELLEEEEGLEGADWEQEELVVQEKMERVQAWSEDEEKLQEGHEKMEEEDDEDQKEEEAGGVEGENDRDVSERMLLAHESKVKQAPAMGLGNQGAEDGQERDQNSRVVKASAWEDGYEHKGDESGGKGIGTRNGQVAEEQMDVSSDEETEEQREDREGKDNYDLHGPEASTAKDTHITEACAEEDEEEILLKAMLRQRSSKRFLDPLKSSRGKFVSGNAVPLSDRSRGEVEEDGAEVDKDANRGSESTVGAAAAMRGSDVMTNEVVIAGRRGPLNKSAARRAAKLAKRQASHEERHSVILADLAEGTGSNGPDVTGVQVSATEPTPDGSIKATAPSPEEPVLQQVPSQRKEKDLKAANKKKEDIQRAALETAQRLAQELYMEQKENGGKKMKKAGKKGKKLVIDLNSCVICGQDFDSRNQLFKHIQSTGHAVRKD